MQQNIQSVQNTSQPQQKQQAGEKYKNVERPLGKMLLNNFLGGIFWSLGVLVGAGIVFSVIAYFVRQIDFVPIVSDFLTEVIESSQNNLISR